VYATLVCAVNLAKAISATPQGERVHAPMNLEAERLEWAWFSLPTVTARIDAGERVTERDVVELEAVRLEGARFSLPA
jgi:hypothetical protein